MIRRDLLTGHWKPYLEPFSRCTDDFEILHGDLQGLPDTKSFSKRLAELDTAHESE
uniref:Uncharacterized protein n=1 Tax=Populus trichocarpa TaxID=3694 RepID=A0A2K1WTU4_POPTR